MPPVIYGGGFSIRHALRKYLTFLQKGAIILLERKEHQMYGLPNSFIVGTTKRLFRKSERVATRKQDSAFTEWLVEKLNKIARRRELARKHNVKFS